MILIDKITKKYANESKASLKKVSVILPDNGLIFITGESGSGKSTFLNIIGGLDKPDSGSVIVDGKNINELNELDLDSYHLEYTSFIYQQYNLIKHGSVLDNVSIFKENKNYEDVLKMVGLDKLLNKNIRQLSGGEKQRVAIARAILKESKIILCDEPTGALDDDNGNKVMNILKKISSDRLVIVVTHNTKFAKKYADRILCMQDGEIISDNGNDSKKKIKNIIKFNKKKYSSSTLISIVKSSMNDSKKRNIILIIAIAIGLSSLLMALSINTGFKKAIKELETSTLGTYPLYISKDSVDLNDEMNSLFDEEEKKDKNLIYALDVAHKNKIDKKLMNYLNNITNNLKYFQWNYIIDDHYIQTMPYNNRAMFYDNIEILSGNRPENKNEVLLLVDSNNNCDKYMLETLGIKKKKINIKDLIGYEYKVGKNTYKITSVGKGKVETFYYDLNCLYYFEDNFTNKIPFSFYLFPKSSSAKENIKETLNNYNSKLYYTDYATTITSVSTTFIDAISVILYVFSIISLIVSTLMIAVITHISIIERTKEIGIFRSLGFSKSDVMSIFCLESLTITTISSILSIIFVYLISKPINGLIYNAVSLNNPIKITNKNILIIVLISFTIGLLGSFIESRKIANIKIADTLRYE